MNRRQNPRHPMKLPTFCDPVVRVRDPLPPTRVRDGRGGNARDRRKVRRHHARAARRFAQREASWQKAWDAEVEHYARHGYSEAPLQQGLPLVDAP